MINLRFADDIVLITDNKNELQGLTKRLDTKSTRFGMEISAENSKTLVVTAETLTTPVKLSHVKQLEQVSLNTWVATYLIQEDRQMK